MWYKILHVMRKDVPYSSLPVQFALLLEHVYRCITKNVWVLCMRDLLQVLHFAMPMAMMRITVNQALKTIKSWLQYIWKHKKTISQAFSRHFQTLAMKLHAYWVINYLPHLFSCNTNNIIGLGVYHIRLSAWCDKTIIFLILFVLKFFSGKSFWVGV